MINASDLGVRLGFAGGTQLTTIDQVRTDAQWAASAGFDSYWVSYVAGIDPLVALPVIATEVSAIELGTDGLGSYVEAGVTDLRLGIYAPDDAHVQRTRTALADWMST